MAGTTEWAAKQRDVSRSALTLPLNRVTGFDKKVVNIHDELEKLTST